jgi:fatty-acyl-CoA synthase
MALEGRSRFQSDNIGSWTALRARRDPHRTALVCGEERTDYAELDRRVGLAAGAIREAGVKPGRRVATALKNRVEFVELLFGTALAGAIFVPLNFRLSSEEVAYALSDSGAEVVFVQADTAAAVTAALELIERDPPRVISVDGPGRRSPSPRTRSARRTRCRSSTPRARPARRRAPC